MSGESIWHRTNFSTAWPKRATANMHNGTGPHTQTLHRSGEEGRRKTGVISMGRSSQTNPAAGSQSAKERRNATTVRVGPRPMETLARQRCDRQVGGHGAFTHPDSPEAHALLGRRVPEAGRGGQPHNQVHQRGVALDDA